MTSAAVLPTPGAPVDLPAVSASSAEGLLRTFRHVRSASENLTASLEPEDCVVQTMPDVSPTKWHLAHTSWFFDTFVLQPHVRGFRPVAREYSYLFNSYYNAAGPMHCRDRRGYISRPTLSETFAYRRHVDQHLEQLLRDANRRELAALAPLVVLGLHHEQQHQELLLMDIKHVFAQNPLHPVYHPSPAPKETAPASPVRWVTFNEGLRWIGAEANQGFSFDNERPRHREFVEAFALADRLVTNGEYAAFIADGGYQRPELWLSLGWMMVQQQKWEAPLYWQQTETGWNEFTLGGQRPLREAEPVCHLSYFEADAYARWAAARLPTEAEWETAAENAPVSGNLVERENFHPHPAVAARNAEPELQQLFGDVWEWTRSAYAPYPGYAPAPGALGEYNGKFMCNQMTLRGGSCATPQSHVRATYRNFFAPEKRWAFSGIRLVRDAS